MNEKQMNEANVLSSDSELHLIDKASEIISWLYKEDNGDTTKEKNALHHVLYMADKAYESHLTTNRTIALCYLHDAIEDVDPRSKDKLLIELTDKFGKELMIDLLLLTDCEGRNRSERKYKTYLKIVNTPSISTDVYLVKALDRLHNLKRNDGTGNSLMAMYIKEHKLFKKVMNSTILYFSCRAYVNWWREMDTLVERNMELIKNQ